MTFSFLGFDFRAVELEDRRVLSEFFERRPHTLSGYTFAALYAYQGSYQYGFAFAAPGTLLISCVLAAGGDRHLLQPVGPLNSALTERLVAGADAAPYTLRVIGVEKIFLDENAAFVRHFDIVPEPENANYIYRATDLAHLKGRAYAKKRNLIAQAAKSYPWTVEPLTAENVDAAREALERIHTEEPWETTVVLEQEVDALKVTLDVFAGLRQEGVLVRVDGAPAGFVVFERQSADTAVIHYERALRRYKGLHQVVNQAAAAAILERGYTFINREEDVGNEGLRQAKQSYNPDHLAEAFALSFRNT